MLSRSATQAWSGLWATEARRRASAVRYASIRSRSSFSSSAYPLALVDRAQVVPQGRLGRVLQPRIHRHLDGQPRGVDRRVAELRDQLAADFVDVPRARRLRRRRRQHDGPLHLAIVLLRGDVVVGQHPIEHVDLPLLRPSGAAGD
jgi:hypothetical protein